MQVDNLPAAEAINFLAALFKAGLGTCYSEVFVARSALITIYFINPRGKLKLLFDCTMKNISQ